MTSHKKILDSLRDSFMLIAEGMEPNRKAKLAEYSSGLLESVHPLMDNGDLKANELVLVLLGAGVLVHDIYNRKAKED